MRKKLEEILNKMEDINYGFVDNNKNIYPDDLNNWDKNFGKLYYLQSPEELMKSKYWVCWDQVELERYYLEKESVKIKSYFIIAYDNMQEPTHTFIVIEDLNSYYWIEHSWQTYKGIHEYKSLDELLNDVKNKFEKSIKEENINKYEIKIFEYSKPKYHLNCIEFMNYCENSKIINIKN